jgi:hypothetical protein
MVAPHEAQALANHCGQSLERLRQRGGLSACEALAILDDRPWHAIDADDAFEELKRRIEAWSK